MSRSRTTREQAAPELSAAELLELSEADGDAEPLESADLLARRMRELAVSHWLLTAADDREQARKQWADQGIALLACGGILSAVRIPAGLVWAAAGTENLEETDGFLRRFFDGGAVFMDLHARLYYVLVPGLTAWKWSDRDFPGVECLGTGHFLGVPSPWIRERRGRAYWCVPMDSPGELAYVDEVKDLISLGVAARAERALR